METSAEVTWYTLNIDDTLQKARLAFPEIAQIFRLMRLPKDVILLEGFVKITKPRLFEQTASATKKAEFI